MSTSYYKFIFAKINSVIHRIHLISRRLIYRPYPFIFTSSIPLNSGTIIERISALISSFTLVMHHYSFNHFISPISDFVLVSHVQNKLFSLPFHQCVLHFLTFYLYLCKALIWLDKTYSLKHLPQKVCRLLSLNQ